jgi:predicted AAA+ superfamily ATPase
LERLYAVYRVPPFGAPRIKAVKKEQKLYCWDWARVEDPGARAENLVVSHLLRLVHYLEDVGGERVELRYFRDTLGREVDAIVLRNRKPWLAVEVKLDDRPLDSSLRYVLERVHIPYAFQVSAKGTADVRLPDINRARVRLLPAARFLALLP